jgi:hypothetical protein
MSLVDAVKRHALDHYNDKEPRWDYIVECWTDEEIAIEIAGCSTEAGAIKKMAQHARAYHERDLNARDW